MTETFGSGAFVFFRARGLEPRAPAEIDSLLESHPIEANIAPTYAGDRVAAGRAISQASSGLSRRGYLLRPLKRTGSLLSYAIVREKCVTDTLDHSHEGTVTWQAEPNPALIEGDHPVAREVATHYQALRGKIVAADWSASIARYLEDRDAARVRRDGRIYWVPPQRLDDVRQLAGFLSVIGIDLVVCEIEPQHHAVVSSVVETSLDSQIADLEQEAADFDGSERPSTYLRRLDEYQKLRERATLYRDALGLGVERAEHVLADLEARVSRLLDIRQQRKDHPAADDRPPATSRSKAAQELRFANAVFQHSGPNGDPDVVRVASADPTALSALRSLTAFGLAGRWQAAGPAQVQIIGGDDSSVIIAIKLNGHALPSVAPALTSLGIQFA